MRPANKIRPGFESYSPIPEAKQIKGEIQLPTAPELQPKPITVLEDVAIVLPGDVPRFLDIEVFGEYQDGSSHKDERPQSAGYVVERLKIDGDTCYSPLLLDWVQMWVDKNC